MSDTSQGSGWWQASDGKWYSPEQAPGQQSPQAPAQTATATATSAMPRGGTLPAAGTLPPIGASATPTNGGPSVGTLPPTPSYPPAGVPPAGTPPVGGTPPPTTAPVGGYPQGGYPQGPGSPYARRRTSVMAIASLVLAILWIFGVGSLLAVLLGIGALVAVKHSHGAVRGRGLAIAGLVIGAIGLILTVTVVVAGVHLASDIVNPRTIPYGQTVTTDDSVTGFTSVTVYGVTAGLTGPSTGMRGSYAAANMQVCVGPAGMPAVEEHLDFFLLKTTGGLEPAVVRVTAQAPNLWHSSVQWPANQCQRGDVSFFVPAGSTPVGVRYQGYVIHPVEWTATGH